MSNRSSTNNRIASTKVYDALSSGTSNYNALGRGASAKVRADENRKNRSSENFFEKKWKSIENALGTTGAAIYDAFHTAKTNADLDNILNTQSQKRKDLYKKYGYDDAEAYDSDKKITERNIFGKYGFSSDDYWDKYGKAYDKNDNDELNKLKAERQNVIAGMSDDDAAKINYFDNIQNELIDLANANSDEIRDFSNNYNDYLNNNYAAKKVQQDRGKFAGSAINTLSTATDVLGLTNGPVSNAIQGGIEGVADELEENGLEDFSWERAGQNALTGATSGAVVGELNKNLSNQLAKNGGNLFKGSNRLTQGLNNLGSNTATGRVASTLATGAGRGALSGAVGGATGAGLQSALTGQDIGTGISNALQGAVQGAGQGAFAGSVMAGANMALDKTPGVGSFLRQTSQATDDWRNSGHDFNQRLTNTLTSGDSTVGEWLQGNKSSKTLKAAGTLGNKIKNVEEPITTANEQPTNLKGWAKQAGKRIVDDVNNSNLGLKTKDVSRDADDALKTSKEYEYRQKANQALLDQYGTIDKPTARATRAVETVGEIADAGFTKPQDVETAIKRVTGSNGEVNKLNRKVIENAGQVNTMDGVDEGTSLNDFIDQQIRLNGLYDTNDGKAIVSEINAVLNKLPTRREGSITGLDSADDVFDVVQMLEKHSANYKGRSGSNYSTTTPYKEQKAAVLDSVASVLKDRIYDASDISKVVTPDVISDMKSWYPNNEKWSNWVDNNIASAKTGADLRSAQAPFVRMGKILDNSVVNSGTFGSRVPKMLKTMATSNPLGLFVNGAEMLGDTAIGSRTKAKFYNKMADRAANVKNDTDVTTDPNAKYSTKTGPDNSSTAPASQEATQEPVVKATYDPALRIYNVMGRTEGGIQGNNKKTEQYLQNAATNNESVSTLEDLVVPNTYDATSVYNSLNGQGDDSSDASVPQATGDSYFQPTGDYWTDLLGKATSMAADANDVEAFVALYEMYSNALSKQSSSQEKDYSDPINWSNSDRTKLIDSQNALSQIDSLESAYNQATGGDGGNAIQGGLRSLAVNISGGNLDPSASNYNNLAQSVGMGIVKNLINLGVTESDANRYLEYLPALTDTKEQASQKLETLRQIYQNQINNLYSAYGS